MKLSGLITPSSSAGDRHDDFERRSRRILSLSRAIVERAEPIFDQRAPLFGLDAAGKDIGIERRRAREREDRAAVNVEATMVPSLPLSAS